MISIYINKKNLLIKIIKNFLTIFFNHKKSNLGPTSVFVNLIEGLRCNGIKFNVNPSSDNNVHNICLVLSGIDHLKKCIVLKKKIK
jgi:hypothetical protein